VCEATRSLLCVGYRVVRRRRPQPPRCAGRSIRISNPRASTRFETRGVTSRPDRADMRRDAESVCHQDTRSLRFHRNRCRISQWPRTGDGSYRCVPSFSSLTDKRSRPGLCGCPRPDKSPSWGCRAQPTRRGYQRSPPAARARIRSTYPVCRGIGFDVCPLPVLPICLAFWRAYAGGGNSKKSAVRLVCPGCAACVGTFFVSC